MCFLDLLGYICKVIPLHLVGIAPGASKFPKPILGCFLKVVTALPVIRDFDFIHVNQVSSHRFWAATSHGYWISLHRFT